MPQSHVSCWKLVAADFFQRAKPAKYFCRRIGFGLVSSTALAVAFCLTAAAFHPSRIYAQTANQSGEAILEQVIAASGGRAAWAAFSDFRAIGTMSLYSGSSVSQSGRAELIGKGLRQFKLTANLGDQNRTWLWNKGFGRLDTGKGKPGVIGRHNLTSLEGFNLPILKAMALANGTSRSILLVGSEMVEGRPALRVRITRQAETREDRAALGRPSFQFDLLVDQKTFSILATEDTIYPNNQPTSVFQHRIRYSDYRPVAGVQVPFMITEEIDGQRTWSVQIDTFEANTGIAGSEFVLN